MKYCLLGLFLILNLIGFSQNIKKAFKRLNNLEFSKAEEIFKEFYIEDENHVGSNYGVAQIYSYETYNFDLFKAYRYIMVAETNYSKLSNKDKNEFYKTGRLAGISSRAGYIEKKAGRLYPFVIMVNTPGNSAKTIHRKVRSLIMGNGR